MQDFRIRPAVPADAGPIASVHVRSWQQTYRGQLPDEYLLEDFWGKGIGKALHDQGMDYLRGAGFSNAMLWVLDTNERTSHEVRYIIQL